MMATKKSAAHPTTPLTTSSQPASTLLKVADLEFDKKNPRFPKEIAKGSPEDLIERFIRDERLLELVESIGDHGFFPGEPLLVVRDKGHNVVVEGNRRLAALKLLNNEIKPPEGRISIDNAIKAARFKPKEVPCLVFSDEKQTLRYLGFRHITGIKAWSALQKARYIERLREENYSDLSIDEALKRLAKETGSKASYMGQTLTALSLYKMAEEANFFDYKVKSDEIDFSVLSTALSYTNIAEFIGLEGRTSFEEADIKKNNLKSLFNWLFVKQGNGKSIVGESRNLKKLAAIVTSSTAVKELSRDGDLQAAFDSSKGPSIALTEALVFTERRLDTAWAMIPKVQEISSDNIERAEVVARKSAGLLRTMVSASQELDDSEVSIAVKKPTVAKKAAAKRSR
jgi:hypothetical protein